MGDLYRRHKDIWCTSGAHSPVEVGWGGGEQKSAMGRREVVATRGSGRRDLVAARKGKHERPEWRTLVRPPAPHTHAKQHRGDPQNLSREC
jgi:hypothetical protein